MRTASMLFAITILFIGNVALGQVVVKQANQEISYTSPMVLEVPLEPIIGKAKTLKPISHYESDTSAPHLTQTIRGLEKYACDGVTIKDIVVMAYGADDQGMQRLQLFAKISVRPGSDKKVILTYDFVIDGKVAFSITTKKIDTEEKKTTTSKSFISIRMMSVTPETAITLRITVNVEDNG